MAIRLFAVSMISIFIPLYLLQLNFSLASVFAYYAVMNAVHAIAVIPAAKMASFFGFKHAILFSIPFVVTFFALLYTIELYHWHLFILAFFVGINRAFFWIGYHTDFSQFSDGKNRGSEIGLGKIFSSLSHASGPLIGGVLLTLFGFKFLFVVVSVLLFASAIPLFFTKDIHSPVHFSIKQIFFDQKLKDFLGFIGYGVESGVRIILWPMFIFLTILNDFALLGFVKSLYLFFSVSFVFIIGRFADVKRKLVLRIGALLSAVIWGIKIFITTSLQVYIIDAIHGMVKPAVEIPFDALTYDKAGKKNIVQFIIFREISIQAGRMSLFIAMIFVSDFLTSFIFGGTASLLLLLF